MPKRNLIGSAAFFYPSLPPVILNSAQRWMGQTVSIRFDSKLVHNLIRRSGTRCKCQFSDIISICNRKPVKRPIFGHFYFEQKSLYLYFLLCSGSGRILHDTFFGQKFVKILEIVIFMTKNMVFWS